MVQNHEARKFADARDNLSNSQVRLLIDEWISDETDRRILNRRLIDGLTFSQLSDEFHLSERQIKNRVYKSQELLFRHIKPL
jgi:AraC-like DNA-binding protein